MSNVKVMTSAVIVTVMSAMLVVGALAKDGKAIEPNTKMIKLERSDEVTEIVDKATEKPEERVIVCKLTGTCDDKGNNTFPVFSETVFKLEENHVDFFEEVSNEEDDVGDDYEWTEGRLTKEAGVYYGPSGKETYYNMNMSGCIENMCNELGILGVEGSNEYGAKTFNGLVMVAANFSVHPRGSEVETSLGRGIVVDTGEFAYADPNQLDIAVNW